MIEHKVCDVVEVNGMKYKASTRGNFTCFGCCFVDYEADKCKKPHILGNCRKRYRKITRYSIKWEIVK